MARCIFRWGFPSEGGLLTDLGKERHLKTLYQSTGALAAGFVLLWNSGFIGAEYALPFTEPLTLLFWRYWALALVLGGYLGLRGGLAWPGTQAALLAGLIGVLAHGVWLGCVFYALEGGVPAGVVALVVALQPLATGAFSGMVTGERTSLLRWAGLLIAFTGVMAAVVPRTDFSDAGAVFAYLIPFGSVVAITAASLIQRRLEVRQDPLRMGIVPGLFYQSLGTALAVTLPAIFAEGLPTEVAPAFLGGLAWLIFAVSLGAYGLMWLLIVRIDATRVASLFYFGPPVTMVMAWIAFGDQLLATDVLGLLIVAAGVLLTQGRRQAGS